MKFVALIVLVIAAAGIGVFLFTIPKDVAIGPQVGPQSAAASPALPAIPEAPAPASSSAARAAPTTIAASHDIGPQPKLADPPAVVKGIYLTGWSAGSASKVQAVINLIKSTELNAVVIDIKDYSGYVSYAMDVPDAKASGAENEIRIARPNTLIKELHDNGIYVIGRITNFQDPILAKAHPEWALHDKTTGAVWKDNSGLSWMDPAAKPVWDYLGAITKDAFGRGFDEVQFDYVRFASDGAIGNISYPYWDGKSSRASVIGSYFKFLRETFPNEKISADLFGLATVNSDDLGIGQIIQDAYKYFDYVSPMVYPSHYATGFLGYKNPASYPYRVIDYSLTHAITKLTAMGNTNSTVPAAGGAGSSTASTTRPANSPFNLGYVPNSKLRPWLQDFNLNGVPYTAAMVRQEKQAVYDTLATADTSGYYGGWLMWNAANIYTAGALDPQ